MKNDVAIYGGFNDTGNPLMEDRDWKTYSTILKGNGAQVFYNSFPGSHPLLSTAILDGFTITQGNTTGDNGGGMYNSYASPTLTNLLITNNTTTYGDGGGIGAIGGGASGSSGARRSAADQ